MVSYISLFFLLLLSSCLFIRSLGQKTFILGPRMQLKKLTVSINYIFIVSHLIYGFSWWFPVFIASHYISEVSAQEYRFSSKTASQFTSLACCRYVQKICAAKMSEVAHVSWTSSFQACRYIKKTWEKSHVLPSDWHSETQLWSSIQASLILSSNSLVRVFPTTLTLNAWRQVGFSMLWDGWAFGPHHSNSSACLLAPGGEVAVFRGVQ